MPASADSPSRFIPAVRLQVQTGVSLEGSRSLADLTQYFADALLFRRENIGQRSSGLEDLPKHLCRAALDIHLQNGLAYSPIMDAAKPHLADSRDEFRPAARGLTELDTSWRRPYAWGEEEMDTRVERMLQS